MLRAAGLSTTRESTKLRDAERRAKLKAAGLPTARESTRRRQAKRREERRAIVDAAKAQPCADCGQRYDPRQVDLDHLPGVDKVAGVSSMVRRWGVTLEQLQAEIAKCEVVCANCHRLRTAVRWARTKRIRPGMAKRRSWLDEQKAHPCHDCGTRYPAVVMDFDHLPGQAKAASVTAMVTCMARAQLPDGTTRVYSLDEIAQEIAKCELVCANCHRLRSASRGNWAEASA
ncbi:hypothetical protein GCM10009775_30640 [Microbacterium aoyamense]|uniref:HNH endonuclease n=1 Tax=Microbacterium aoyamense TaxID=344166 RepID=A0ABN2PZL1_9MICO